MVLNEDWKGKEKLDRRKGDVQGEERKRKRCGCWKRKGLGRMGRTGLKERKEEVEESIGRGR